MDGRVKVFLEKIEELESYGGLASIWLQAEDNTDEETAFSLQGHLRDLEDAREAKAELGEDNSDYYDDHEGNDGRGDSNDPNGKFPINYLIDIEGDLYRASDIKSMSRTRNFEDGYHYWSIAINSHESDYQLGFRNKMCNFATENERDVAFDDITQRLEQIKNVVIL